MDKLSGVPRSCRAAGSSTASSLYRPAVNSTNNLPTISNQFSYKSRFFLHNHRFTDEFLNSPHHHTPRPVWYTPLEQGYLRLYVEYMPPIQSKISWNKIIGMTWSIGSPSYSQVMTMHDDCFDFVLVYDMIGWFSSRDRPYIALL